MNSVSSLLPTFFISHGGGPWPWMKSELGPVYDRLESSLRAIPKALDGRVKAVLVISAHWEAPEPVVMAAPKPPMLYDYYGFPPHTYQVEYPALGSPELAERVAFLLREGGFSASLDRERGFDHGAFVPLAVMYPDAELPILQLSIQSDYDVAAHLNIGRALAPLRNEGVLILASGLSYHNLRLMGSAAREPSAQFDAWLHEALAISSPAERTRKLMEWSQAPAARIAHPREDHLVPLFVAVGAAEDAEVERIYYEDNFFGHVLVSSYRFG